MLSDETISVELETLDAMVLLPKGWETSSVGVTAFKASMLMKINHQK